MPPLPEPYVLRDRGRLEDLMKRTNHSYRTLARVAEQGKSPLQRLAAGKQKTISYPNAERIAKALDVGVEELFKPQYVVEAEQNDPSQPQDLE